MKRCIYCFLRITTIWIGMWPYAQAQQFSLSAGSDISSPSFQAHISIGQLFGSFQVASPHFHDGLFSVLVSQSDIPETVSPENSIHVYPNPATTYIHIETGITPYHITEATIYSLQGMIVGSYFITDSQNPLSVSQLPPGSYVLRLSIIEKQEFVFRILKII